MKENPNYYSIIPANVRYDNRLKPNEKLLYSEITALSSKSGECWASNNYFSQLYGVTKKSVSCWVNNLKKCGYIDIKYTYCPGTKEIDKRIITLNNNFILDSILTRDTDKNKKPYSF